MRVDESGEKKKMCRTMSIKEPSESVVIDVESATTKTEEVSTTKKAIIIDTVEGEK